MLLLCAASAAQGATLIEYNFDTQIDSESYADQSGNGYDLIFNRNVSISANYPFATSHPELAPVDRSGRTRYNATTTGEVSGATSINLNTTQTFTMEGWIYLEGFATISDSPQGGRLWAVASSTGGTSRFALQYNSSGQIQATFNSRSQAGGTRTINTGVTLDLNEWVHLAYVKTASAVLIYMNGALIETYSEASITNRALPTSLDSISVASNIYGYFDDFRFSNTALSPEELGYYTPFTTVPEPSTLALLAGTLGTGVLLRRKKVAG